MEGRVLVGAPQISRAWRKGGPGVPVTTPTSPPLLASLFLSKQPTVFEWPKLFSTLCLTQCDPLLKNPGYTREFIASDYLCVLTVFLNSTSRVVSLPQPGRLHFTINRSQSCIEELVKDEDDSEIQVYINTNFVFWKLVDTSFLVINGTLWNFALTSVNKCNPRPNYLPNPGSNCYKDLCYIFVCLSNASLVFNCPRCKHATRHKCYLRFNTSLWLLRLWL